MEALTTEPKSDGRSKRSRTDCSRIRKAPKPKTLDQENAERTASALSLTYRSILPRIKNGDFQSFRAGNGYSAPSYNRLVIRNMEFWAGIADEIKEPIYAMIRAESHDDATTRRIVREYMDEAAVELGLYVSKLPQPLREVVELKSLGLSWKAVMERLPNRVYYSALDDYGIALRRIWTDRSDLIRRLI